MIDRAKFIGEFSDLLKEMSEPRYRVVGWILDYLYRFEVFKKFAINNPEIIDRFGGKRDVPVERIRFLSRDIYNLITDKRKDTNAPLKP